MFNVLWIVHFVTNLSTATITATTRITIATTALTSTTLTAPTTPTNAAAKPISTSSMTSPTTSLKTEEKQENYTNGQWRFACRCYNTISYLKNKILF